MELFVKILVSLLLVLKEEMAIIQKEGLDSQMLY